MAGSKALPLLFVLALVSLSSAPAMATSRADFFYLTLMHHRFHQWPGAIYNSGWFSKCWFSKCWFSKCCCPTTGKPAQDFLVQGFETYDSSNGEPVTNCSTYCRFSTGPASTSSTSHEKHSNKKKFLSRPNEFLKIVQYQLNYQVTLALVLKHSDYSHSLVIMVQKMEHIYNQLRKLIFDLYAYWPDISCPSNNGRQQWENAWCTYGSCSNLNKTFYFQLALALRAQVNLLSLLESKGIMPSNSRLYNLKDVQDALIPTLGFSTVVECNQKWWFGESHLYKIRICVSMEAETIISCPIQESSNCGSKVKFLPFNPNELPFCNADNMADLIKMPAAIDMDM